MKIIFKDRKVKDVVRFSDLKPGALFIWKSAEKNDSTPALLMKLASPGIGSLGKFVRIDGQGNYSVVDMNNEVRHVRHTDDVIEYEGEITLTRKE